MVWAGGGGANGGDGDAGGDVGDHGDGGMIVLALAGLGFLVPRLLGATWLEEGLRLARRLLSL